MLRKSLLAALCGSLMGTASAATIFDRDGTSVEAYGRV